MFKHPLARLRALGLAEGVSFLVLLCIAMPLKYLAHQPLAVKYVGWAHGLLFMLYVLNVFSTASELDWPFKRTLMALVASVLPLGTFVLDGRLKREQQALEQQGRIDPAV